MTRSKKKTSQEFKKDRERRGHKVCGYARWGNDGPVEQRGQISVPMSRVKLFRKTFHETERRKAITAAIDWVCAHSTDVLN